MAGITTWYLQMQAPGALEPRPCPPGARLEEARVKQFPFNRFLYEFIGGPWQWTDKLDWTNAQWRADVESDRVRTWVLWCEGSPAGYFELGKMDSGAVDIRYFGLARAFIGRGLGGYMLTEAIREAWAWDALAVTVNTCSLDHPAALSNYQARGFEIVRTVED